MPEVFAGVDTAPDWLDIHHPGRGEGRIDNAPSAARAFAAQCAGKGVWVVFEAGGRTVEIPRREAVMTARVRVYRGVVARRSSWIHILGPAA